MSRFNHFMLEVLVIVFIHLENYLVSPSSKPNIIFIIADDLGWNDVGFHGSSQIPTPNIDALAYSGVILNNYYVNPICTPSRSALMTGKYPIHTGMQHGVLYGAEPRGLPLTEKLLPEYLKELGYVNHLVGKWHLGSYKKEYTPTFRGFDSHLGIWTGHHDYFDHTAEEKGMWGLDMRRNMEVAFDLHGKYSTDVFTHEAEKIVRDHNKTDPLFLYIAHVATHSGNTYNPLPAPDADVEKFSYIKDYERQRFGAMLSKLDESVGKVVKALKEENLLENSIIVFTSDNGGPAAGFNYNAASNFPLRGVKNTLWQGGVRGAALLWSPFLKKPKRVSNQLMHIVDWLPTLLSATGAESTLPDIDGLNLWNQLSKNLPSTRKEVLLNIDDWEGNSALVKDQWKLLKGTTYNGTWDDWYGPSGRNYAYNVELVERSDAGAALIAMNRFVDPNEISSLRQQATIFCNGDIKNACHPLKETCLFNIENDPCEYNNVAETYPDIVTALEKTLEEYNSTALPPGNLPIDERGNPKYWNYVYTTFGDELQGFVVMINK